MVDCVGAFRLLAGPGWAVAMGRPAAWVRLVGVAVPVLVPGPVAMRSSVGPSWRVRVVVEPSRWPLTARSAASPSSQPVMCFLDQKWGRTCLEVSALGPAGARQGLPWESWPGQVRSWGGLGRSAYRLMLSSCPRLSA